MTKPLVATWVSYTSLLSDYGSEVCKQLLIKLLYLMLAMDSGTRELRNSSKRLHLEMLELQRFTLDLTVSIFGGTLSDQIPTVNRSIVYLPVIHLHIYRTKGQLLD